MRLRRIDRIEAVIHQEVGRNIDGVFAASRGGLWGAASRWPLRPHASVGIMTGFFVPRGTPPAAETDGPVGAALLARRSTRVGVPCRLVTDEPCRATVRPRQLPWPEIPVDVVPLGGRSSAVALWRRLGVTHALSIERCGRSADGAPRNMRGEDISAFTTPLDELFLAGPWQRIAIGDGGNEIGMGSLPRVADRRLRGARRDDRLRHAGGPPDRRRRVPLGRLRVDRRARGAARRLARMRCSIAWMPELDRAILQAMVNDGPAVDGVTRHAGYTVDSMPMEVHHAKLRAIRAVVEAYAAA